MELIYTGEPFPTTVTKTVFLAGPTPRDGKGKSWRPEALEILERLGYDGHVFVPEGRDGAWRKSYDEMVDWEEGAMNRADAIVFWVPRDIDGDIWGNPMPAFTTNDEWGTWKHSGKAFWGNPDWAQKCDYQRHWAKKLSGHAYSTLTGVLEKAVEFIGEGGDRTGGECTVPAFIWNRVDFQTWYGNQWKVGNVLEDCRVEWPFWVGEKRDRLFLYALHVNVHITNEDRNKTNEVVVLRPDISTVVAWSHEPGDRKVVMVWEFRSPVNNDTGYVLELPGGSGEGTPLEVAQKELQEETGLNIDADRFVYHGANQIVATLATHRAHLFSVQITKEEIESIDPGPHGDEDGSERTWVEVVSWREWAEDPPVGMIDWSNLGMISRVLGTL